MIDYKEFTSLSEEESKVFADKVLNDIKNPDELADTLLNLALFTNGQCLIKHYPKLIERKIFYPCEIYMHADKDIAQRLILLVDGSQKSI